MAHEITETDRVVSVREPAWHGLAEVWDHYPTREELQTFAHAWEPVTEPVYQKVPLISEGVDGPVLEHAFREVSDFVLNARSDNGDPLGVVSSTYELVRNAEMYDIAEALEGGDPATVRYETAGSLKGGRKVWLLLRLAEPLVIHGGPARGDDPVLREVAFI